MALDWNAVLQGATTGVVASTLLAIFALLRYRVRDWVFWWQLRRELRLSLSSCGHAADGITVGVRNHLGKSFNVRHLAMVTDKGDFKFNPTLEVSTSFKKQYPLTRLQKRAVKRGESISMGTETQYKSLRPDPIMEGFVAVEPFTIRKFVLPYELLAGKEGIPLGMRITVEYEAWPGRRKIFQRILSHSPDQIRQVVAFVRREIASGTINILRQQLGRRPITPQRSPEGAT